MENKKTLKFIENLLKATLIILFLINLPFLLNIISYAQNFAYTLFKTNNKGFNLRYSTNFGSYNLELSKDPRDIPTIHFYSTNTSDNRNRYKFLIKPFYGRSLLYSVNQSTNDHIVIDLIPPNFSGGNYTGEIHFYKYTPAPEGGYYVNDAKIYGNIEDLIAFYNCEDGEWKDARGTCLGKAGNPLFCFGNSPDFGHIIFNGLLVDNFVGGNSSGLTICVRTNK
ncbi:MAG: hypothetical protein KatS3mg094_428 [Candidatus Parcubacteria bacterium]|nr:MAG: hypothetical protein KatS3mg094_428 [Candidatus Parcubacteria bacterium]